MQVDIILEPDTPDRLCAAGLLAESLGFSAVWVPNIMNTRDPFLGFAPLAMASSTIRMGPIAVSPFELHPVKMANALLTLQEMSGNRANLVVGGGGGTSIALGLKEDRGSRIKGMVQGVHNALDFLRAAAGGGLISVDHQHFAVENYSAGWFQGEPPLLYAGASKPRMLRMATAAADGLMMSDVTEHRLEEVMGIVSDGLADHGRDAHDFRVSNLFSWHVKPERAEAEAEARRKLWVRGMLDRWYISPFLSDAECDAVAAGMPGVIRAYLTNSPDIEGLDPTLVDELVRQLTLTGTPEDVDALTERLLIFKAAGLNEFAIRLYDQPEDSIRLIGERVLPALRS